MFLIFNGRIGKVHSEVKLSCFQPVTDGSKWIIFESGSQSLVSMVVGVVLHSSNSLANSQNLSLTSLFSMHSAPPRLWYWVWALLTSAIQVHSLLDSLLVTHHFEWSFVGLHVLAGPRTFFIVLMLYTWLGPEQSESARSFWQPHVCIHMTLNCLGNSVVQVSICKRIKEHLKHFLSFWNIEPFKTRLHSHSLLRHCISAIDEDITSVTKWITVRGFQICSSCRQL